MKNHSDYRADIDGLRAIAVGAVVLFHAFPRFVTGGFVGVDIFFVISGYLISGILIRELDSDRFSLWNFYDRRIRRIFPALITVVATCLVVGWFIMMTDEFRQLGKHLSSGIAFISNFVFWMESGYFDAAAEAKPTLHFWSLAVEEQFYLFWPLLLWFLWRRTGNLLVGMGVVAALSLLLSLYLVSTEISAAFYLPFGRTWELAAGGLLAEANRRYPAAFEKYTNTRSLAGLILMALAILYIDERRAFPGYWAILPVAGAVLYISAGPNAIFNRVMSIRTFVGIGLISYPLYLWHWPVFSFQGLLVEVPSNRDRLVAVAVALVLAYATYRLIELPLRKRSTGDAKIWRPLSATMTGLLGVALLAFLEVLPARHDDPKLEPLIAALGDWEYPRHFQRDMATGNFLLPGNSQDTTVFLGDSHMEQYGPRIAELAKNEEIQRNSAIFVTDGACPFIHAVKSEAPEFERCHRKREIALRLVSLPASKVVVVGGCWNCYLLSNDGALARKSSWYVMSDGVRHNLEGPRGREIAIQSLTKMLADLKAQGKEVFLILDNPMGQAFSPKNYFTGTRLTGLSSSNNVKAISHPAAQMELNKRLRAEGEKIGIQILDPALLLCPENSCAVFQGVTPIYKDDNHLRPYFVRSSFSFLDRTVLKN